MRNLSIFFLAAGAVFVFGRIAWPAGVMKQQESQAQYSADSVTESADMTFKEKVYVAPGKQRKEMAMGGRSQVSIVRMDKGVMWMLMPEDKMYMEMDMKQAKTQHPGTDMSGFKFERTEEGKENINGHAATKYKVSMTDPNGNTFNGFEWIVDPGIQVKLDAVSKAGNSKGRIKMELTNLKIGRQDPALFEIPEGYTKMTMPSFPGMGKDGMKGMFDKMPGMGR